MTPIPQEQIFGSKKARNMYCIAKLIRATTTIGFYYAVDHGIDTERVRKEATSFFDLELWFA